MSIPFLPIVPESSGPQCLKLFVTKAIATEWLKLNIDNRTPATGHIAHVMKMMDNGEWLEDAPCSVSFTRTTLIDGQHRLFALVGSKLHGVNMWVFHNVPESVQSVIDSGWGRTMAQRMKSDKDTTACISWIHRCATGYAVKLTPRDFDSIATKYHDALEWSRGWAGGRGFCRAQLRVAVMELWMRSKEKAEEFRAILINGHESSPSHPAMILRRNMTKWLIDRKMPSQTDLYRYCVTAINAAADGRELMKLYRSGNV